MKHLFLSAALAAGLLGTLTSHTPATSLTAAPVAADSPALAAMFDKYWDERAMLYPLEATGQGDNRYNDQLPNDGTVAYRAAQRQFFQQYLDQIKKFDRSKLSDNDRVSYDIFLYEMQMRLEGLKQPTWMIPFNQMGGLPIGLAQLGAGSGNQPFKTTKDYDNWLGRVRAYPVWADTAISNFRRGMRAGVVLPRPLVEKMLPQLQAMVTPDATKSIFYGPIGKFPAAVPAADQQRLTAAYQQAIKEQVSPTYQKLHDFLKNEYLPKARTTTGISAVPGGESMYRFAVKNSTTTDMTPDQIYQVGLSEVKRIRAEMEKIKTEVGFKGDLPAFFNYLNTDPKFMPFKTAEEVLNVYRGIQAKIDPNLKKMFSRVPKTGFEVRQTEAFRAASASAQYNRGLADGSRPGIFYVPIIDPTKYNVTRGMESLFLHEAIPGHHYQIALQQENTNLPKFRRYGGYSVFSEGWALYTESLGKELGLYTDPYQRMGALNGEMHRAIRLVVDVGMHSKNMTREQAIAYMRANRSIDEQAATAEIERYMAWPGQALSYKIGQLKISELRQKYEKQLGGKFNLSAFHDELLENAAMPLAIAEKTMDAWAATQK
ncbi:hypothetical protein GCM10011375_21210 [Hymenobacter qilianensis]|uniref:Uncharacterized protein n=2 Tax=Hymenobacter qilianensis TaxID=1385715 RepID=A0ACB5PRW9_9BACT|nr:DUF885 domain-containing protein [Hymenobacter qilianensis]QNP52262.1 DUF885 domain-containing protein [Hymenobacter qilianensis]GGF65932.1 hypothetical protein GCM10011375_21210 [Hymenobacter qilianensis]